MRTWKTIPVLLVALAPFAVGQSVTLLPDIGVAQAEYHDAIEAWLHSDRDLEKDLLTGEAEQMRRRVKKAAVLRDEVMVKKQAYLDLIVQRLRDTRAHLAPANASEIPVSDFKKDLEAQQGRMLGDQERLDELLKEIPEGDEYFMVRRALEAERTSLINLQNTVALRIHSLDNLDKSQDAIRGASRGETEAQKLDEILKVWDGERAAAIRQRSTWAGLYRTMEQAIDDRAGAQKKGTAAGSKGKAQKPTAGSSKPPAAAAPASAAPAAAPAGNAVGLAGTWVYRSQPGAWSGYGEPETVTLELHRDGAFLRGTYTARLPVRGGVNAVQLSLAGAWTAGSTVRLHWTSQTPVTEGEMQFKLASDGRLFVERIQSKDGYIPLGMEVLSLR
jgi:hypothetical protein